MFRVLLRGPYWIATLWLVWGTSFASNNVLLNENGITITEQEIAEYLSERLLPEAREAAIAKPGAVKQAIGNLYIIRRSAEVARLQGLVRPEREIWEASSARDRYAMGTYVESETAKRSAGVDWRALAKDQYLKELEEFGAGVEVKASHILISSEEQDYDQVVEKVAQVRQELLSGKSFEEVAQQFSDDPSASRNAGFLGYVRRGQTAPTFEQALFAMTETGELSDPVISPFGVHIIRYEGQRDRQPAPFERLAPGLIKKLKARQVSSYRELSLEPYRFEALSVMQDLDESEIGESLLERMLELEQ